MAAMPQEDVSGDKQEGGGAAPTPSYRELQAEAKGLGIKAIGSHAVLTTQVESAKAKVAACRVAAEPTMTEEKETRDEADSMGQDIVVGWKPSQVEADQISEALHILHNKKCTSTDLAHLDLNTNQWKEISKDLLAPLKGKQTKSAKGAAVQYRLGQKQLATEYTNAVKEGKTTLQWIKEHDAGSKVVTHGRFCKSPPCEDRECCQHELAHSTWVTLLKKLRNAATLSTEQQASFDQQEVADYLKERHAAQLDAGRIQRSIALITPETVEALCYAADVAATNAWEDMDMVAYLYFLQWAAIFALDVATGRRNADITKMAIDRMMLTKMPNGMRALAFELVLSKVLDSPGFCMAVETPDSEISCPVRRVEKYLEAAKNVGANLKDSKLLFPKIVRNGKQAEKWEVTFHPPKGAHASSHPLARRPVDTDDVNETLVKLMAQENINEGERAFRIHKCRTAKVLMELGKGTQVSKINKLLGWSDDSQMFKVYGRLTQLSALMDARSTISLEVAHEAQNMVFTPIPQLL
jgi:hypothetical protein